MRTLKLIISIGLLSSFFVLGLVTDANADVFNVPDFYTHGAFSNADFSLNDNDYGYYPNYYQTYTVSPNCMDVNGNEYYRGCWDPGE